jgi:hypothetical protein
VASATRWPPPIAFDAPLCPCVSGYGRRSLASARNYLSAALHKDNPDRLLTRGVLSGHVEELLHGLWFFTAKLVHQGSAGHARPEHRYNVGVTDLLEFMAFLGKMPDVIPQGLPMLLLTTLQIPWVAGLHICALEIAGKDILEILLAIN